MRRVEVFEARTHPPALLAAVSAGEEITITRHGRPVARLVPPGEAPPADLQATMCCADEASPEAWLILQRLQSAQAQLPALWLWDTGNGLLQAERRGCITPAAIGRFLGLLQTLPIANNQPRNASAWHDTLAGPGASASPHQ
jgi:prevent-host-death family protein